MKRTLVNMALLKEVAEQLAEERKALLKSTEPYTVFGSQTESIGRQFGHLWYAYKFNQRNQLLASSKAYTKEEAIKQLDKRPLHTPLSTQISAITGRLKTTKERLGV